jgi:hypothetical protein
LEDENTIVFYLKWYYGRTDWVHNCGNNILCCISSRVDDFLLAAEQGW